MVPQLDGAPRFAAMQMIAILFAILTITYTITGPSIGLWPEVTPNVWKPVIALKDPNITPGFRNS